MKTFYYTYWSWSRGGFKCWLHHVGMSQFTVQSDDFKRVVVPLQSIVYLLTFTWIKQDSRIEGISQQTNVNGHSFMKNVDTLERAPTSLFGKYVKCTTMGTVIIRESLLRHSGGFWTHTHSEDTQQTMYLVETSPELLLTDWAEFSRQTFLSSPSGKSKDRCHSSAGTWQKWVLNRISTAVFIQQLQ